jgi:hypothetical protein
MSSVKRDTEMLPHMVDIDALNRQSDHLDSMVAMLHNYFDSAANGGDELSHALLSGYLWQMQHTIFELKESIREASDSRIPRDHIITATNH